MVAPVATSSTLAPPPSPCLVLLLDSRWGFSEAPEPGVCCWRHGLIAAAQEAGASVRLEGWQAPSSVGPREQRGGRRRALRPAARLARRVRRGLRRALPEPVLRARRGLIRRRAAAAAWLPAGGPQPRHGTGRGTSPSRDDPTRGALRSALSGASLVLAETIEAADAAARAAAGSGLEVWALVLPGERMMPGQPLPAAGGLRRAVERAQAQGPLAGLVTDSQPARDTLERMLSPLRVPVVVLPPLVPGRACSGCAGRLPPEPAPYVGRPGGEPLDGPGQLALWRALLEAGAGGGALCPPPWSFPASRLLGERTSCPDPDRGGWGQEDPRSVHRLAPGWDVQAQRDAVARLLDATSGADDLPAGATARVAVVGFDLKFIRELAARLDRRPDLALELDEWPAPGRRTRDSEAIVARSDVLLGEWVRPNAAWLAREKRPGQYLVLRLHRFELDGPYPAAVDIDRVDAVVHISPLLGRRIRDELGWPEEKLVYVPNFVDVDWLDRTKHDEARFTLGLPGAIPSRKRLDLALDLLAAVRSEDRRFTLNVRTQLPWENRYTWDRPEERVYYARCWQRIETDPLLRGAVTFEPFGRDIAAWLRRVGQVLCTSDAEGAPVGLSEGMASGAVPVTRDWPGARELYGGWAHASVQGAAERVLESADPGVWAERSLWARRQARRTFDPDGVVRAWTHLLHGRREEAAAVFAEWSPWPSGSPVGAGAEPESGLVGRSAPQGSRSC